MNNLGYFNDNKKEYVIKNMFPKRPLINFLWNETLLARLNHFGGGYCQFKDENDARIAVLRPGDSRLIYIKDTKTGKQWSPNRNFNKENFEVHNCEVGQGYSKINSKHNDIECSFNIFIPPVGNFECWEVIVKNSGKADRELMLYSFADIDCNITCHSAFNKVEYLDSINGVLVSHPGHKIPTPFCNFYFASEEKPIAFETLKSRFRGMYSEMSNPESLLLDKLSCKRTAFDEDMIGALQFSLNLKANESKTLRFIVGLAKDQDETIEIFNTFVNEEYFEKTKKEIESIAKRAYDMLYINTPDEMINRLANIWLKRQISVGKTWGRGYSRGFRDIMQDITGFLATDTKIASDKIIDCLTHQYENGNTQRSWTAAAGNEDEGHPYRDGAAWILPTISKFLKETGDLSFSNVMVDYFGKKSKGTIFEHCQRGVDFLLRELGENGLCIWEGGDWNDSINSAGLNLIGESVWLSMAAVRSANEFAELLDVLGKTQEAKLYRQKAEVLRQSILKYGWDKDHFIYGINDWREKLGAYESKEGKIFLNPQAYAVLADIVDIKTQNELMDLVERELKCDYGYVQLKPSYTAGDEHIGRVSFMQPGTVENGSVYNHGATFKIAADCKLGRGNIAYDSVVRMIGTNPKNPSTVSGMEPYVISNMYLGPENICAGEAPMSWLTGTAGWLFRCILEYMVGISGDYKGLKINPVISSDWKEVTAFRQFRGANFNITIKNPKGLECGKTVVTVNGNEIDGNVITDFDKGKAYTVVATIE